MGQKQGPEKRFYVVNEQSQEGRLAITWFRRKWKGNHFFMGFQEGFAEIAKMSLGSEAKDVFLFILGRMDFSNMVTMPQVEIARQLGMKKQNVSRAIKTLLEKGVLIREDPLRKRQLRLNHKYAWKGKLKHLGLQPEPSANKSRQEYKSREA